MKIEELKKVLKPLIKEVVKEMILEDKLLSTVVKECISGMKEELLVETKEKKPVYEAPFKGFSQQLKESSRQEKKEEKPKVFTIGGVNVFEGTQPKEDSPALMTESKAPSTSTSNPFALAGITSDDPGCDLSVFGNIFKGQ